VRLKEAGGFAVIEVQDTGMGMEPDFVRERLFKPFVTTKGNAGMGIGVYEVREYARSEGGDVEVDTAPGAGTLFRLSLPLEEALPAVLPTTVAAQVYRGQEQA
jgi:signal transduction histidine kinase